MKVAGYMCYHCNKAASFPESDKREKYFCPNCGRELKYFISWEKDEKTGLAGECYMDKTRTNRPIVECPYCHSTNTRKLPEKSVFMADNLFWGSKVSEVGKNFHCNKCGADF